jgi:hypothetical protein
LKKSKARTFFFKVKVKIEKSIYAYRLFVVLLYIITIIIE